MRERFLEIRLIQARPTDCEVDPLFTDKVMSAIQSPISPSLQIGSRNDSKRRWLFMKVQHLPRIAVVAIAIVSVLALATVTYAAVKTVETLSKVSVVSSTQSEYGRKQFTATSKECKGLSNATFELQKNVPMTAQDGASVLEARCDLALVSNWLAANVENSAQLPSIYSSRPDTVMAIDATSVTLQKSGRRALAAFTNILRVATPASANDLKVGDTVFAYPDGPISMNSQSVRPGVDALFIVTQPAKYYASDMQSYVDERTACRNNLERQCLNQDTETTHTYLMVAKNDTPRAAGSAADYKEVQGQVVSYGNTQITLDTGGGVLYTIATPSNIIASYNQSGVYGLAKLDDIYSHTNPEDLKIAKGDSLSIDYLEDLPKSSPLIPWAQVLTINLLVQHSPEDSAVLVKY